MLQQTVKVFLCVLVQETFYQSIKDSNSDWKVLATYWRNTHPVDERVISDHGARDGGRPAASHAFGGGSWGWAQVSQHPGGQQEWKHNTTLKMRMVVQTIFWILFSETK